MTLLCSVCIGTKEAARWWGTVQRHERLARPLCVRVQWRKSMHYLTQWDTDTPFAVPPCGANSRTKRDTEKLADEQRRETDKLRHEITSPRGVL
ncbi:hypothetical protein ALC53_06136 [Atta colombica]|uniref:Uncharacterized protein n=1 Tax=Atta colombica TaxID=520822 RepID=A0A195BGV6_9HYME|nr:hypothetical protein ALC53_06136 [Atta colombica]